MAWASMGNAVRVGIDGHMLGARETGNETYVRGLVAGLSKLEEDGLEVVVYGGRADPAGTRIVHRTLRVPGAAGRLLVELPWRSRRDDLSLLHSSYFAPPWSPVPTVVTVHDVTFNRHPEWFSRRDLMVLTGGVARSIARSAHVVTDSQASREEIIATYAVDPGKVTAIPLAPGSAAQAVSEPTRAKWMRRLRLDGGRPYLFTVSGPGPRKNRSGLVSAFEAVTAGGFEGDLVIAGPMGRSPAPHERVRYLGYLPDDALAACFQSARGFVMASWEEGFGLPVMEAMAHGLPVATSRGGALAELFAGSALVFDPADRSDMATAISRILTDTDLRRNLTEQGVAQAARYSWTSTARATLAVYRVVAASS